MILLFIVLMASSGFFVSYLLVKASSDRVKSSVRLFDLASTLEDGIRYKREPVAAILGDSAFEELAASGDPEVAKLTESICSSDYEAALNYAALLKIHTEKEMRKTEEEEKRARPMMTFLPPAAAALAAILLI